jgi:hypothetical protein
MFYGTGKIPSRLTMDSQWTHNGLTAKFETVSSIKCICPVYRPMSVLDQSFVTFCHRMGVDADEFKAVSVETKLNLKKLHLDGPASTTSLLCMRDDIYPAALKQQQAVDQHSTPKQEPQSPRQGPSTSREFTTPTTIAKKEQKSKNPQLDARARLLVTNASHTIKAEVALSYAGAFSTSPLSMVKTVPLALISSILEMNGDTRATNFISTKDFKLQTEMMPPPDALAFRKLALKKFKVRVCCAGIGENIIDLHVWNTDVID